MGVTLMENFEVDAVGALTQKGWVMPGSSNNSIGAFTENGLARKSLLSRRILAANSFDPIKIPIPDSKVFYFSTRVRWSGTSIPDSGMRLCVTTAATYAGIVNATSMALAIPFGAGWALYANVQASGVYATFGLNEWITLEVARKADGTLRVWVNDVLLYTPAVSISVPPDSYLYVGRAQVGGSSGGATVYGWEFSDVVVVDPATAGRQNRPGSSGRVQTVPFTADVVAEWAAPSGVTTPHYQLMADFPATVDTSKVLTGTVVGQREQYQASAVPAIRAGTSEVLSVCIEKRISNAGGAAHAYETEVDTGSGISGLGTIVVAPNSGYVYQQKILDTTPAGANWTPADVAAMKAGLSVKS